MRCTQRISEYFEDEQTYACDAAAVTEALTTAGQWEPRCGRHGLYYPAERRRPLPLTDLS